MSSGPSGKGSRPSKIVKGGTESTRKHRFQSFNQRISKLKIDPVRRSRSRDVDTTQSFFQTALHRWRDLNVSENFTNFVTEVVPLSDSLPQILHYQKDIMGAIVRFLELRDTNSLEPLLDLLANFAHDLGARFECYFSNAVRLVASLAAKHPDVEVIEWSFECLAWLFKYLLRLLRPDLRPVFDIMAPYLGRESQKTYTTRFAAEALSFLVRQTALIHHRDPIPLDRIVRHIVEDFNSLDDSSAPHELYQQGLMTLFVESTRGIDRKLHSSGTQVYICLLENTLKLMEDHRDGATDLVYGTTIGILQVTDAEGFQPISKIILEYIEALNIQSNDARIGSCGHLLFVIVSVRKGSRIADWVPVLKALISLLELCDISSGRTTVEIFKAAAVTLSSAPLEFITPSLRAAMKVIAHQRHSQHFLAFCTDICSLNRERFHSLLFPYFNKWVSTHWQEQEIQLYLAIPKLFGGSGNAMICPESLQENIVMQFKALRQCEEPVIRCNAFSGAMEFVVIGPETTDMITNLLESQIEASLALPSGSDTRIKFSLGAGLRSYAQLKVNNKKRSPIWPRVYGVAPQYGAVQLYLKAVLISLSTHEFVEPTHDLNLLIETTTNNLHSSSHVLRLLSLQILDRLHVSIYRRPSEAICTALRIEESPLDLGSARSVSMHARKLSGQYETILPNSWSLKVVPHFCFGMLSYKLSQLCNDAAEVIKAISGTLVGEDFTSTLAFQWLEGAPREECRKPQGNTLGSHRPLTPFQCSNLSEVEAIMTTHANEMSNPYQMIAEKEYADHEVIPQTPAEAPSMALRVLIAIPRIAEKRSRQLVPIFLRWAADESKEDLLSDEPEVDESQPLDHMSVSHPLARKDRKAMLDLFGQFTNPKVLYRASEVHNALLGLLASGDVAIQRSALRALLTWKSPSLMTYQENLTNLLDDLRFREELTVFVNVNRQDSMIQDEHRRDLMPVLIRILYGKVIARSGPTGRKGQTIKRKAVLEALARFDPADLEDFANVALGPLGSMTLVVNNKIVPSAIAQEYLDSRKQVGLVHMLKDMLRVLGDRLAPLAKILTDALLYCLIKASRSLRHGQEASEHLQTSMLKDIRQVGLQCLTLVFRHFLVQDLEHYLPVIFDELINPRMERFAVETSQSVSGLLQLFSEWASSHVTVAFFTDYNPLTLKFIVACLADKSAKEDVKLFVLEDILKQVISLASTAPNSEKSQVKDGKDSARDVLYPHMDYILQCVGDLLRESPSKELLESAIHLIAILAPLVEGSSEIKSLLEISAFLLDQPSHRVKPKSKGDLIKIVENFVPLLNLGTMEDLQDRIFRTISSLFGFFRDRVNRQLLPKVLKVLANQDRDLCVVADLCADLNSFSTQKLDEPDFEVRLRAFSTINDSQFRLFSPKQWRPIVWNMLFYIRDDEELAIRSNASFTLRRFVEVNREAKGSTNEQARDMISKILLPELRKGVLSPSELVRAEYLSVMAHLIRCNADWEEVNDMSDLLCNDDDEASFFVNVLHIQQHRRLRALRRLAKEALKAGLRSMNVAHFFIPLLEHFIFDKSDDESAHNLSAEAVNTIGALAQALEWPQFRAMFRRFSGYIQSKPELEKTVIKLLGVIIDSLNDAALKKETQSSQDQAIPTAILQHSAKDVLNTLAATMPKPERLTDDILNNLLPSLIRYLHDKDESTVSLRVPVAVSIVKLLKLLPATALKDQLPPVLTDICNILRSRAQESRDLTRKTLVDISRLIGPNYFGFVLKELRSSLLKGYQLHVLSFTVHAILVATADEFEPGELDYCLPQIVSVIMDDIFGATGQEKDAEEYVSKMKEVKSSKSYDSMELVAKTTSIDNFVHLIRPLQNLLQERLDLKLVKKIDELLRRIGVGLLRNSAINDRRALVFCHEIIRESYRSGGGEKPVKDDPRMRRFLINMKGVNKYGNRGSTSSYGYKLARFSIDLLRSILQKYDALQTSSNIHGFIPIIGDSIIQSNEEIQASALRLLTAIIKVPLKDLDENAGIYVSECVKIIKSSTSTNSELAQAALKLVSSILRERKRIEIRENDLAYLLKRLIPDLEEPDRQGVTFNFIKSVLARKMVITEVYEVLDNVAAIMVTNQTQSTRDVARSVYFQFIQDFPQGKGRFTKQMTFLVKNLNYRYEEGRRSVMEAIHLFISKIGEDLVQDILGMFFVPLVMVMVNDESAGCREMAGTLVKMTFERADSERMQSFLMLLRSWLGQDTQPMLMRVALQIYCIFLDSAEAKGEKELSILQTRLLQILKASVRDRAESDWEILYFALQIYLKICQAYPTTVFSSSWAPLWVSIRQCLEFPHVWVKLSTAKILGTLFADFGRTNAANETARLPLQGSGGLRLTAEDMLDIARISMKSFRVTSSNEELASQSVRNLVFLGRNLGDTALCNGTERSLTIAPDEDDIDLDSGEENQTPDSHKTAIQFIFERASAIIRRGPVTTKSPALTPMKAAVQLIGALCNNLPLPVLTRSIQTILLPLYNLTDPSIPAPFSAEEAFTTSYKALVANSTEIMSLLQKKLGTTEYIANLARVRAGVKGRREDRRNKRKREAVVQPEKTGILKKRKGEKKREKRKERSGEERGRRRGW